ncbi:MAG: pyruvate kinase [Candidatus Paceibacterota bacterium]
MKFKRTKIVATIGPASSDPKTLEALIKAGMNVARINFSHGDHAEHGAKMQNIREVSAKLREPIAMLQDLAGPKVRIGDFEDGSITLVAGQKFTLSTLPTKGSSERVFIDYPHLHKEVKKGDVIMLDDGRRKLVVQGVRGTDVVTTVVTGGTIKGRRGVNAPGAFRKVEPITKKDKLDLAFGLSEKVDYVALSFVRRAEDVKKLRALITKLSPKHIPGIISKIETPEAVADIDAIIAASDGIMVARGDLAVEVSAEQVPFLQKQIIRACVAAGKPVITATQMLESMTASPVPTRAEVADVANAILDGTDAVMLSEESALGKYPLEAVKMMATIARETENQSTYRDLFKHFRTRNEYELVDALGRAVAETAVRLQGRAIVALSEGGYTGRMIARHRPMQPIIVFTPHETTARRLALSFACHSYTVSSFSDLFAVIAESKSTILKEKLATKGDNIILVAGIPLGKGGNTNTMMVQKV